MPRLPGSKELAFMEQRWERNELLCVSGTWNLNSVNQWLCRFVRNKQRW